MQSSFMYRHLLIATIPFILLVTTTFAEETPSSKSFTYKTTKQGDLSLNAFFPSDWKAGKKHPAIVFFFGGGWTGGKTTQFEPQAKYLAGRGMVVFCADYRVK